MIILGSESGTFEGKFRRSNDSERYKFFNPVNPGLGWNIVVLTFYDNSGIDMKLWLRETNGGST